MFCSVREGMYVLFCGGGDVCFVLWGNGGDVCFVLYNTSKIGFFIHVWFIFMVTSLITLCFQGNAVYNIMPDVISRLSDPEAGVEEDSFKIIMKYILYMMMICL